MKTNFCNLIRLKVAGFVFFSAVLFGIVSCSGVSVETGENFEVVELPDGSVAFLNHDSEVGYDIDFETRTVNVQGEVFLSVVESDVPFVVRTELGDITVLGTEFSVKSIAEELEVEVEEGVVELKTKTNSDQVKRGEAAVYRRAESEFKKVKAEFKFRVWMKELKAEFKRLGKDIKVSSKKIGKESKKAGKQLKKDLKKLR